MENISKHVSYNEATFSNTAAAHGISNAPNEEQLLNMKRVAEKVFEPVRVHFNVPIYISSMFRSKELNDAIPGASYTSQHCANNGAAMDIDARRYGKTTNEEIFSYIKDNLEFDQLIAEGVEDGNISWVHVSLKESDNRNQVLVMYRAVNPETDKLKSYYLPYTKENYNKYIK